MPRFYFDVYDGQKVTLDEYGDNYTDIENAAGQAINLLNDFTQDILPSGDLRDFGVAVKDHRGRDLYCAALIFRDAYLDPNLPAVPHETPPMISAIDPVDLIRRSQETRRQVDESRQRFRGLVDESKQARSLLWLHLQRAA